ncbi:tRNA (cytosine(72)-C(5))-methyltransferase NSUN6 [Papilio machaon]|uniref:tRNA (cytosine(72)-C(5))-methyltransferase NSUN6 n=1 Tax=Papilio machaon TaxID=76193 RepID=UPI001E665C06|nr:tRNA (cytosine(72)-C(5))-methyltransferase NSUN6 [Papilio machaon]
MNNLTKWLSETPNFTSFRINKLKEFDIKNLREYLETQNHELGIQQIPNTYLLKEDCLIVEKWPENVCLEKCDREVIVDVSCATAVLRGAHVFAPGVLALPTSCKLNERVDVYGDLDGQCKRGLKVPYEGRKIYVGTGYLKMQRYHLFDNGVQPSGIAIHMLLPASRLPVINESIYPVGHILLQNLPSIVVGWVLNVKPGEHILDMCAAPGNKTTHLAEMSNNQAHIIALDKTKQKTDKISKNLEAHGITCVKVFPYNSEKCYTNNSEAEINEPPFPLNSFDKVLLDAPCSGLGQRPQLTNTVTPKMLQSYKHVQRKLFEAAIKVLKVDGILVYSTCTITEEENERMVAWVLKKFPNMQLVPAEPLLGGPGLPNVGLSDEQRIMVQRFGPEEDPLRQVHDIYKNSIGFFTAKFIKIK